MGGFISFSKSAVLSHFRNRRFYLIFEIGGFVSFSESAVLSHFRNRRFCPISKISDFVSFKIGSLVLPPLTNSQLTLLESNDVPKVETSTTSFGQNSVWTIKLMEF